MEGKVGGNMNILNGGGGVFDLKNLNYSVKINANSVNNCDF
jgi:hypothetical protein